VLVLPYNYYLLTASKLGPVDEVVAPPVLRGGLAPVEELFELLDECVGRSIVKTKDRQ
jgi:hypothetical protein